MDVIKRAWLYVTRKKKKSVIMLFLLFTIATSVLSGISIKKATYASKKAATEGLSNFFCIKPEINSTTKITKDVIDKILGVEEIKKYNATIETSAEIKKLKKVTPIKKDIYPSENIDNSFTVIGNVDTESDLKFVNKSLKLVEGRHITKNDKNKLLIHKELAEINNLKVGSKLILDESAKNVYDYTAEIVGIFDNGDKDRKKDSTEFDLIENYILSDINVMTNSYKKSVYNSATFYTNSNVNIDSVISKVKELPIDWENLKLEKSENIFLALSKSFETMDKIVNIMLIGTIIISSGILSLILAFWIQGRVRETGILLSIGVSKFKIVSQYIVELLIIAVIGFSLSYFSAQLIAQNIGESLINKTNHETVKEIKRGSGFTLGNDPESSMLTHTTKDIDIKITPSEMIYVWVVGSVIITASVAISSISIIRLKPKEILSKMS